MPANFAFGEHSKLAIRDSSDRKNWAKHYSLFFCISLTILCTVYPFVFTCGWSERPSVKANDTEPWMQCNTFGADFHLIQNGGTTKWYDTIFDFLAAEAFPGILQPIKSTIATGAPLKLKRRNVVFKLKNTTFILFFLSARYDLSTIRFFRLITKRWEIERTPTKARVRQSCQSGFGTPGFSFKFHLVLGCILFSHSSSVIGSSIDAPSGSG